MVMICKVKLRTGGVLGFDMGNMRGLERLARSLGIE
jgi:hypothetical protein